MNGKENFKDGSIMKQLFKVLSIGLAATALFSCNKEIDNQIPESSGGVRKVEFVAGPVTRTVFGTPSGTTLPTLWTTNKNVSISLNFATALTSSTPIVSNDGANASFSVDIEDGEGVIAPYLFYAVSPSTALISMNSTYKSAQVDISASQTPLENSVDEGAQVLVAKYNAGNSFPTSSITMDFAHLTAYGKISFSHLTLADGETVASVSLTAAENWAGRYYYYFEDNGTNEAGDLEANSASKTITLTTNKTSDIWFACAPVDLGGKKVNVVITTNAGTTYSKEITIPTGKTFASGKVNSFTVNMSGISPDGAVKYELVTSPSDLTVGSKVIIAAPGDVEMAMSTTQNTNNRGETAVTKAQNNTVINSPSDAVQVLTITAGNKANTIGFSTGDGYLYAASSEKNWLRTESSLSNNSSWVVSIDSDGIATVVAQGESTRNHLRYNGGDNLFSCYASNSSVDTKVSIYKKVEAPDTRDFAPISWGERSTASVSMNGSTFTWTDPDGLQPTLNNSENLTVTYSSSEETVATINASTGAITLVGPGSTVIKAVYAGAEGDPYKYTEVFYTLTVTDDTAYSITVNQPSVAGCTISATPNTPQKAGTQITLAVTATAEGCSFKQWIVKDASDAAVVVTDNQFIMPASNVTVTADFLDSSSIPDPETIDFSTLGLSNNTAYNSPFNGGHFTVTFDSVNGSGKYFTTGTAIRVYGGGSFTVASSDYPIAKIELTFGSGDGNNALTTDVGSYSSSVWRGDSKSVTFSVGGTSGQRRIKSIKVTYVGNSDPAYAVSWTTPTEAGCNISATVDGNAISSGDMFEEGTVVTITATSGNGFAFGGWTITGATATNASAQSTTFTVGTTAVTFSAAFNPASTVTFIPGTDTGETTVSKEGITVSMTTMDNNSYYQVYANDSMTVSSTSHTITGISFTCTASGTAKYGPGNASANTGTYSYSGQNGTWSGSSSSVTISTTAQIRMTSLTITYE